MKKLSFVLFAFVLLGAFTLTSCGNDTSSERAKDEVEEAADAVGDAMVAEKNEFKNEINDATAKIDRKLEKLNNDLKEANADAKADIQKEIDELQGKRKKLAEDLENFGEKAGAEWEQFKGNVRETMKDLGDDN